ncbi:MAG: dephospho-CoA kinase [Burkholderiales bacterium]
MRFKVGLTGGIGSGKSTVADLFTELGVTVIDADQLAHQLTAPGGEAIEPIRAMFGPEYIEPLGALDRARMRDRIFSDAAAKKALESILHPMIRVETDRRAAQATSEYVILMIPLLVETGDPHARCDRVLVVDCPESLQIERVMARNKLARDAVEAIMAAQVSRAERLRRADDVIDNSGTSESLRPQVEKLHASYRVLARKR